MRVAAIDLGTNTFLCLVADVERGEITRVLSDQARVVRLGQGVHGTRRIHPEALARADECLRDFSQEIARHAGVDKIVACATSAARDAENGDELLKIGRKHGIEIEIISGEREAEATYWGTVGGGSGDRALVGTVGIIDVGGGSTEFIVGDAQGIRRRLSVDVGSVRMTELFVASHPVRAEEMAAMAQHIRAKFAQIPQAFARENVSNFIAVAGTPTTLAAVDLGLAFEAEIVHGHRFSVDALKQWTERLAGMTVSERQQLAGMDSRRADVIVAGVLVLRLAAEAFGATALTVSVRGLRYGLALLAAASGDSK
ncbi:MAG: Ppx/GppA family phosphatase [Bdellovibrionaceae bacterium]|nr:Ppx/GppA family phosphatase [Pseudobdellovibrionaceae bacterium]